MEFGHFLTSREAALRADPRPQLDPHAEARHLAASTLRLLGQMTGHTTVAAPRTAISSTPGPSPAVPPPAWPGMATDMADRKLASESSLDPAANLDAGGQFFSGLSAPTIGSAALSSAARAAKLGQDALASTSSQDFSAPAPTGGSPFGFTAQPWSSTSASAGDISGDHFAELNFHRPTDSAAEAPSVANSADLQRAPGTRSGAQFGPPPSSAGQQPAHSNGAVSVGVSAAKRGEVGSSAIRQLLPSIETAVDQRMKALESSMQARINALREEIRNYQSMRAALYR